MAFSWLDNLTSLAALAGVALVTGSGAMLTFQSALPAGRWRQAGARLGVVTILLLAVFLAIGRAAGAPFPYLGY